LGLSLFAGGPFDVQGGPLAKVDQPENCALFAINDTNLRSDVPQLWRSFLLAHAALVCTKLEGHVINDLC
jgi:hypothetical protein